MPAQRVGAVAGEHLGRVDDVAAGLRHLLPVGVHDQAEADDVAVGRRAEDEGVDGEQRVEPAPRLVDGLADEVGRERRGEGLRPGEGVVVLRGRHRSRVEPRVEHGRQATGVRAAALVGAGERDLVHGRAVEVEVGQVSPRSLLELADRSDARVVPAGAAPDGQRRAPVAVPGERPVDVALQPLAEPAVLDVLRMPADALVLPQQHVALRRGADEPGRLGPVDQRGAAPPAVGVAVRVRLRRRRAGRGRGGRR